MILVEDVSAVSGVVLDTIMETKGSQVVCFAVIWAIWSVRNRGIRVLAGECARGNES